jgi:hypothetical protein
MRLIALTVLLHCCYYFKRANNMTFDVDVYLLSLFPRGLTASATRQFSVTFGAVEFLVWRQVGALLSTHPYLSHNKAAITLDVKDE